MKVIRQNISLIFVALAGVFFLWSVGSSLYHHKNRKPSKLGGITIKAQMNRFFVVLLMSEKGGGKKALASIHEQGYPHYRVMRVHPPFSETIASAISECKDEEIILFLRGEDWLAHDEVLKMVNLCYEDPNIWMTYGNYVAYPSYKKGSSKEKPYLSPLHSGYAGLFKKIKKEDCIAQEVNGFILPASQLAQGHVRYIPDVLYVHNRHKMQKKEWEQIDSLTAYEPLTSWRGEP